MLGTISKIPAPMDRYSTKLRNKKKVGVYITCHVGENDI